MPAKVTVDEVLLAEARELGNHKTKKATVAAALDEYVRRQRRLGLLDLEGKIDFWPDFDPRTLRKGAPASRRSNDEPD